MPLIRPIDLFLRRHTRHVPERPHSATARAAGQVHVYSVDGFCETDMPLGHWRFYKASLLTGTLRLVYASRQIVVDRPALVFTNPLVPYACERVSERQGGAFCLFDDAFLSAHDLRAAAESSPLMRLGADPVLFLSEDAHDRLAATFERMLDEERAGRPYRAEVIASHLRVVIYESLRTEPNTTYTPNPDAASRLVEMFVELLDRQFPVDPVGRPLALRTPGDFAACLSVHVNTLNRAIRETAGMTTTEMIAGRLESEARVLLRRTDWPIADVAVALGFESPAYFSRFVKRCTGVTPTALRVASAATV